MRLQRSRSCAGVHGEIGFGKGADSFDPSTIKPETLLRLAALARAQAARLPRNASEVRLMKHRMPKGPDDVNIRMGLPIWAVAEAAACRLCQGWIDVLRHEIPHGYLAESLSHLAHNDVIIPVGEEVIDPITGLDRQPTRLLPLETDGPLTGAMKVVVPSMGRVLMQGWEFVEDVLQALSLQDLLDKDSVIIKDAGKDAVSKAQLACGSPFKVWVKAPHTSDFNRSGLDAKSGFRITSQPIGRDAMACAYVPYFNKGPGPDAYNVDMCTVPRSILNPHRAEFSAVGKGRTVCTALHLYHRAREL